jgi:SAM-dependent methyltransferase
MEPCTRSVKDHYDEFLAEQYLWMTGGFDRNAGEYRDFFARHAIRPARGGTAIDLGAGCGFASIPLAEAGFSVVAVDFCRPLLDELRHRAQGPGIETAAGDIADFAIWAGRNPELIVCTGDTLTHLADTGTVRDLVRQCHAELVPGGTLVLMFRDYTAEPEGGTDVIPVRRDIERIFLCRLVYLPDRVLITDILYDRRSGTWVRTASEYDKLRLAPAEARKMLLEAGFRITALAPENGMIVMVAEKPPS